LVVRDNALNDTCALWTLNRPLGKRSDGWEKKKYKQKSRT